MAQVDRVLSDRLTGMIPTAARLSANEESVFEQFREIFDLRGASVIEIGGRLNPRRLEEAGIRFWCSVDPRNAALAPDGPVVTVCAPASKLNLESESIDLVFSCNAFQHIHELAETLDHVAHLVRPGGYLYANFGPIWSAPDGSHVENLMCGGRIYNFWDDVLLPSWAHLVYDEEELAEVLTTIHAEPLADNVARYVFHSRWVNRLFFEDYLRVIEGSLWRTVFIGGCEAFDYPYQPPRLEHRMKSRLEGDRLVAEIRKRHGSDKRLLKVRDLEIVLKR